MFIKKSKKIKKKLKKKLIRVINVEEEAAIKLAKYKGKAPKFSIPKPLPDSISKLFDVKKLPKIEEKIEKKNDIFSHIKKHKKSS